ncbi:site-specific integrase [Fibrella sp. WM1]|uniref:site-specific integrase n=1 Tax=Fibrella musci TaxID=3242485 RepID=UPI003522048C
MPRTTSHKEGRATVRIVYRLDKADKEGLCPFWLRVTKDRKTKYVATGLTMHPKYWNAQHSNYREAIRKNYPSPFRTQLIEKLAEWENKYSQAAAMLTESDERHDVTAVISKAIEGRQQARRTTLLAFFTETVESLRATHRNGTADTYLDVQKQLASFLTEQKQVTDVSFEQVNLSFCNQFEAYLRQRSNTENTMSQRFRVLRTVLNRAIADGAMKPDKYPFARNVAERSKFSVGKFDTSTRKRAVSREDIRKVEEYEVPARPTGKYASLSRESERMQLAKDVFLFSYFVAGINFVDLAQLRWQDVQRAGEDNYRISYVRQKTGGNFSLKLIAPAVSIIERYRRETYTGPDAFIFPILNKASHSTADKVKNRLHKVLGQVNTDLKTISDSIGLATPLTTYVARHSFATNLKRAGHASAVIGQALGHKDETTTNIYLDSFGSGAVDAAFDSLL